MEKKLPPDVKAKWTTALRSGKYLQGKSALRSADNRYCCLGVLADVCGVEWLPPDIVAKYGLRTRFGTRQHNWLHGVLPVEITDPLTMQKTKHDDGNVASVQHHLANMNDNYGRNFNQIADWIEENL